jgi:hypothetical protein
MPAAQTPADPIPTPINAIAIVMIKEYSIRALPDVSRHKHKNFPNRRITNSPFPTSLAGDPRSDPETLDLGPV